MKQEVAQLLVSLEKYNIAENFSIFIPSVGREVVFNSLTVKQQKDILKSAFDTKTAILSFIETFNNIIAESSKEPIAFNILDKTFIALKFKSLFFNGKTFGKDGENVQEIDLEAHLKTITPTPIPTELMQSTINVGPITAECSIPSLTYETAITKEAKAVIQDLIKDRKEENLKEAVGELYIFEILKFIKTLKYTFNNEPVTIDMTALPLKEKASVFENLPLSLNNLIIDYIKNVRNLEKPWLQSGNVTITIDPIFFNKTD